MIEAINLKNVDQDYRVHQLAFLNHVVRAEKPVGKNKRKPVYKKFTDFFDYEKALKRLKGDGENQSRLQRISQMMKEKTNVG